MTSVSDKQVRVLSHIHRGLLICFIFLALVFIVGTIYGVFFHSTHRDIVRKNVAISNAEGQTFTGIGLLRAPTSDSQPGIVILSVIFIYYPHDKAFSEELALRVREFREIIVNYIGSCSLEELQKQREDDMKSELLNRFNTILRLGQIETLYFSDFMIVG